MNKAFRFLVNAIIGLAFLLLLVFVVLPLVLTFLPIVLAFVVIVIAFVLILIPLAWLGSKFGWATYKKDKGKIHVSSPFGK